ncbi:MAG: CvpA family protein [Pseudomonadota bacterium]
MNTVDVAFLVIILLSVLLGILRGLVGEILSLLSFIANIWVANHYAGSLAPWIGEHIALPGLQYAFAFVLLYGMMWIVTASISYLCGSLISAAGLGWLDRALGTCFGFLRGICIVLMIVMIVGLTPIPRQNSWQEAMLTASAEHALERIRPFLADPLKNQMDFRPAPWIKAAPVHDAKPDFERKAKH